MTFRLLKKLTLRRSCCQWQTTNAGRRFIATTSEADAASLKRPLSSVAMPQPREVEELEASIQIKTAIPGPRSSSVRQRLQSMQEMGTVTLISDLVGSTGNYLKDVDGNTYLDCFMQIATLPLGYNHPALISVMSNPENVAALVNRPAMPWFPNEEWVNLIQNTIMSVAPQGLDQIYPMMCGSCSNENAIKLIFMKHMKKIRNGRTEFTAEELESSMAQTTPGVPNLCILSFKGGFHGRTLGLLSCSNSRPLHGIDIPQLKWPRADFPRYRYPLEEFVRENEAEDRRCLASVEEAIEAQEREGCPVAGILVEPIQAEGGDHHGSASFFQGLGRIAKKHDVSLMMDEVQTGGGSTGKMWCHEHFDMNPGPDIVTFAKKMFTGGIYHNSQHRPDQPGRIMNTWVGDPHKVILLKEMLDVIQRDQLLELNAQSGKILLEGLRSLEARFPGWIGASRGIGTFCATDCPTVEKRDKIVNSLRQTGVLVGGCGEKSIRLRPALIFGPRHANVFLDRFEAVLGSLENK